jgi:hypothetical protein
MNPAQFWFQSGGYQISRSLRFNRADTAYLNWTPAPGGGVTKCAVSMWVKRSGLGTIQAFFQGRQDASNQQYIGFTSGNNIEIGLVAAGSTTVNKITSAVYRDTSAWYHIFFYQDNTLATAEDRYQLYVNGVRVTAWGTNTNTAPQSTSTFYGSNNIHYIGAYGAGNTFDGYITESHFIYQPATVPTVSDFGETDTITNVWKPKKYAGTYGTNGFYLNFSDNSGITSTTLGKDSSGNGNNWTPNNFSVTAGAGNDSLIDTPTPYADGGNNRGNYCTWLPQQGSQTWTFSNGNLDAVNGNAGSNAYSCVGTIAVSSGKWYWEITVNDAGGTTLRVPGVGIMGSERNILSTAASVRPDVYLSGNGTIDNSSGSALQSGFSNMAAGDIVGVALDAGAKTVQFYRNGSAVGTAQSYSPATVTPSFYSYNTYDCNANFGQRPFAYTPPSGFVALNTQNLPEPSIKKPSSYFDATTYTGNGATPQNIVNASGFQPDLVWTKSRSNAVDHFLADSVRGANNILRSNLADAEAVGTGGISAFNSNGFSVNGNQNTNTYTYVGWQWKESATPGFDIVTYTGTGSNQTISHSLGVTPAMYITKRRNATNSWIVYHQSLGNNILVLESTSAVIANSAFFSSYPNSSSFYPATDATVNASGGTYATYLWSEVAGFSKFGSYTGNGSSDGPFVFCGFRPRWVMIKRTDSTQNWPIVDSSRDSYNIANRRLFANLSDAEDQGISNYLDLLSNGFKCRDSNVSYNASGGTYVFAAFSESAFKYSLAR